MVEAFWASACDAKLRGRPSLVELGYGYHAALNALRPRGFEAAEKSSDFLWFQVGSARQCRWPRSHPEGKEQCNQPICRYYSVQHSAERLGPPPQFKGPAKSRRPLTSRGPDSIPAPRSPTPWAGDKGGQPSSATIDPAHRLFPLHPTRSPLLLSLPPQTEAICTCLLRSQHTEVEFEQLLIYDRRHATGQVHQGRARRRQSRLEGKERPLCHLNQDASRDKHDWYSIPRRRSLEPWQGPRQQVGRERGSPVAHSEWHRCCHPRHAALSLRRSMILSFKEEQF